MSENLTVKIIVQPGKISSLKASQIARLIEAYIKEHPEIVKNGEENK